MLLDVSSLGPSARDEVFNRCNTSTTTSAGDYIGSFKVKERVEQGFADSKIAFLRSTGVVFGLYDNERIKSAAHGDNNWLVCSDKASQAAHACSPVLTHHIVFLISERMKCFVPDARWMPY